MTLEDNLANTNEIDDSDKNEKFIEQNHQRLHDDYVTKGKYVLIANQQIICSDSSKERVIEEAKKYKYHDVLGPVEPEECRASLGFPTADD